MAAAVGAIRRRNLRDHAQQVFDKYDGDSSGGIEKDELMSALKDIGMNVSAAQCEKVMKKYGGAAAKELNKEQFTQLVDELHGKQKEVRSQTRRPGRGVPVGEKKPWHFLFPTWKHHEKAHRLYTNKWMQMSVAAMILGNFFVNITEKEIDPYPAELQLYGEYWENFDVAFNIIFLFELLLNAWGCGGPYKKFWASGWNVFDFIVVAVGVILMSKLLPPNSPLSNLKMLRAFRVFRLFKRIKALNKVIMALIKAIPGVTNAFIIMVIFMMIYAILAVEYFAPLGQDFGPHGPGYYVTFGDTVCSNTSSAEGAYAIVCNTPNHTISADTDRGFAYGWEYYGTFTRALFTLFQVMTGESWAEAVARPLMFGLYRNAFFVAIFFVSFILLTQIVLTNVVVAVLLDKFVDDPHDGDDEQDAEHDELRGTSVDASAFLGEEDDDDADAQGTGGTQPSPMNKSPSTGPGSARFLQPVSQHQGGGGSIAMATAHVYHPSPSSTSSPFRNSSPPPHLPPPSPWPSLAGATPASSYQALSVDDKLTLLLSELASLRAAVSKVESGVEELRGAKTPSRTRDGGGAKGSSSSDCSPS